MIIVDPPLLSLFPMSYQKIILHLAPYTRLGDLTMTLRRCVEVTLVEVTVVEVTW